MQVDLKMAIEGWKSISQPRGGFLGQPDMIPSVISIHCCDFIFQLNLTQVVWISTQVDWKQTQVDWNLTQVDLKMAWKVRRHFLKLEKCSKHLKKAAE